MRWTLGWLVACAGGDDEEVAPPVEEYGCVHVAEGDIVDVSPTREDAREIVPGRDPYRVNLLPGAPGFLRFRSEGAPLVLLTDFAGAVPATWTDDTRTELAPGEPDPFCDEDIPSVQEVDRPAGEHVLEVGPIYQANVWLLLGS